MKNKKYQKNKKLIIGLLLFAFLAIIVPSAIWVISQQAPNLQTLHVTVVEAQALVNDGAFLLDVRTQEEWDESHVPGAVFIPLAELPNRVDEVPDDVEVVVMCRSGNRSQTGRDILLDAGFNNVYSMDGGINAWIDAGFGVE